MVIAVHSHTQGTGIFSGGNAVHQPQRRVYPRRFFRHGNAVRFADLRLSAWKLQPSPSAAGPVPGSHTLGMGMAKARDDRALCECRLHEYWSGHGTFDLLVA